MKIEGRRVLITGATGGIGQAIARELGRRGARLTLTGRRTEVLEPLAAELGAEVRAVDLADEAAVAELAAASHNVDAVVANAALPGSGRIESFTIDQLDRTLDVNLRAPIVLARELAPLMAERRRGSLVFISSLSGKAATNGSALYSATKFGLRGFAFALRADLDGTGVGVSVVNPGFIRDAGMFHESGTQLPRGVATRTPEQVAAAVAQAIQTGQAEIDVAPVALRAGAWVAAVAPGLAQTLAKRLGSAQISEQMAAGQSGKR